MTETAWVEVAAGATALPTATVLIRRAATAATRWRAVFEPNIVILPFCPPIQMWRADAMIIQAPCQLEFSAKNECRIKHCERWLVEFTTDNWEFPPLEPECGVARYSRQVSDKGHVMFGKLAGAIIGEKIAGRNRGAKGALLGAGAAALARRGFGPLAGALALGWGAKKVWEWRKGRGSSFPPEAAPRRSASQTRSPS